MLNCIVFQNDLEKPQSQAEKETQLFVSKTSFYQSRHVHSLNESIEWETKTVFDMSTENVISLIRIRRIIFYM